MLWKRKPGTSKALRSWSNKHWKKKQRQTMRMKPKLRGEAMQAATNSTQGGMASVIGLDSKKVQALCDAANKGLNEDEKVQIVNYLCTGSYVVSSRIKGVEAVEAKAKFFKARMVDAKPHFDQSKVLNVLHGL
ncbi:hypothetical protein L7F22_040346 [Adiantum nelumboides]|nr:hypothetical protein [Adiantum nelumboides]